MATSLINLHDLVLSCEDGTRLGRQGLAYFAHKLLRAFVEADDRTRRVIRCFVQIKHLFHWRDKRRADFGNAPFLYLPRFQGVFLKVDGLSHG